MKQKMLYLSDENFDKLKGINASALVNELLNEHFQRSDVKTMTPEQRAFRIKELEIELEAVNKLEALKNANQN